MTVFKLGKIVNNKIIGFYHCEGGVAEIYDDYEDFDEIFKENFINHFNNHPTPRKENFDNFRPGLHSCACDSIEMLKNWFQSQIGTDILDILIINGCKLYSFETEIVFKGKSQICYESKNVLNITELHFKILFK